MKIAASNSNIVKVLHIGTNQDLKIPGKDVKKTDQGTRVRKIISQNPTSICGLNQTTTATTKELLGFLTWNLRIEENFLYIIKNTCKSSTVGIILMILLIIF